MLTRFPARFCIGGAKSSSGWQLWLAAFPHQVSCAWRTMQFALYVKSRRPASGRPGWFRLKQEQSFSIHSCGKFHNPAS